MTSNPRRGAGHLRIAMIGTRGVPAAYGGFETAVEEVGARLASAGHEVIVYSRGSRRHGDDYRGMRVVDLAALRQKQLETLSHTGLSVMHAVTHRRVDCAFVFNAANAPFLPLLRARGVPSALHVDGLEWRRSKWGRYGKRYYRWAERFGVRNADALIADAPGIAEYYRHQFGVRSELIRYGAPILESAPELGVRGFGLLSRQYHLVVARFERENHVLEIVDGYHRSASRFPLVVVGSAPYSADYTRKIHAAAHGDARVRFLGGVYEQGLLDALYVHARSYVHGHSVGGTNPSLLRAMGAGTAVIAYRVPFNVEVLGGHGWFFGDATELVSCFHAAEMDDEANSLFAASARARARESFRWDETALGYEALAARLSTGESIHQTARSARRSAEEWTLSASPGTDTPPAEAGH